MHHQSEDQRALDAKERRVSTTGHVDADGTLTELLYDPALRETALAVSKDGRWTVRQETTSSSGERLVPYRPGNPLIAHQVVVLPSEPTEYGSTHELAAEIGAYLRRYVDLPPDFEAAAVTYVLLTWVYDAFNELPYLRVIGDYGSGKTRFLLVLGALCYKAFFGSGASTVSPLFHIQDAFRGTLVFDEADFRLSDEKAEVVKILNNGNVAGMPVLRTMQNSKGELQPRAFQVFGPKVAATRGEYDDRALESRFLTQEMGSRPLRGDIPINLPDAYRDGALALRNKLLAFRFRNRWSTAVDASLVNDALEARRNQIVMPLLSVAPGEETAAAIKRLVEQDPGRTRANVERRILAVICDLRQERAERGVAISAIADALRSCGEPVYACMGPKYVGSLVRTRLGLSTVKRHGVYVVPPEELAVLPALCERFGLFDLAGGLGDLGDFPADAGLEEDAEVRAFPINVDLQPGVTQKSPKSPSPPEGSAEASR